jgi:hypothetical protein
MDITQTSSTEQLIQRKIDLIVEKVEDVLPKPHSEARDEICNRLQAIPPAQRTQDQQDLFDDLAC